jgi:uncharacterized membrane protein YdcZ (DUF606 family)
VDFKHITVVWIGFVGGLTVYTGVAYGILTLGDLGLGVVPARAMSYVAAGGVALMLSGVWIRRRLVAAIPRSLDPQQRLQRYFTAFVVGMAVVEAAGLLVITLSIVADTPTWALAGGAAAIWTMVVTRPRRDEAGLGAPPRR